MRKQIYCLLSFLWISCLSVSAADRWAINSAGGITWQVDERVPHEDHIESDGYGRGKRAVFAERESKGGYVERHDGRPERIHTSP